MCMHVWRLCSPDHWPRYRYSPYLASGTIRLAFRSAGRNCSRLRVRSSFRKEITSRCVTPQILWPTPFVPGIRSSGPPCEFMEANNDLTRSQLCRSLQRSCTLKKSFPRQEVVFQDVVQIVAQRRLCVEG